MEVQIGGKKRPVRYGFNALRLYEKESGKPIGKLFGAFQNDEEMSISDLVLFVYVGLRQGDPQGEFTLDDVGDWLDADFDKLALFIKEFSESMPKNLKAPETGQA